MKLIKILFIIILFYFLALLQSTFLVHFNISGMTLNLVLIFVVIWNVFEKPKSFLGIFSAGMGGFFLDIFSHRPIGFNILILIGIAIFIKLIFKKYVQLPFIEKT